MPNQEYLTLQRTPEDTLIAWTRILNTLLANLSSTGAVAIAPDSIDETMIDWGTGSGQVSAEDIPINDLGGYFTTDNVNAALQQLGAFTFNNQLRVTSKSITGILTISETGVILATGTITLTLPTAVGNTGYPYYFTNIGTGIITIDGNGTETIQDDLTFDLYEDENLGIVSDGTNWKVV